MMMKKTFGTLFKKPLIFLLMTAMCVLPYFMAALIGDGSEEVYGGSVVLFSVLFTVLLIGPTAAYTYDVCSDSIPGDWFARGLFKNTFKIIPIVLVTRLLVRVLTGAGFGATLFYGTQMYLFVVFGAIIATTFEAVTKVSISATDDFTGAIDHAISISKNIYLKIALISFVFGIIQIILFSVSETETVQYYVVESSDSLQSSNYIEIGVDETVNTFGYRLSVASSDLLFGLFDAFTKSFILVYCAHHFIEDKRLNDQALQRLTWKEKEGY